MVKVYIIAAFVAGQFWAYALGGAIPQPAPPALASAPVIIQENERPDIKEIIRLLDTPKYRRAAANGVDEIALLIEGGLK